MQRHLSILGTPALPLGDWLGDDGELRRRAHLPWLETALFAFAAASLGYFAFVSIETRLYQAYEDRQLDDILTSRASVPVTASATPHLKRPRPASGSTIGRVEIPRLGVSAVVRAGDDARTLRLAVGYIPGTALPGEEGNVGLAGHRDTFFRRLRDIRVDDLIRVATPEGVFRYRVARTVIVNPKDVWVLNSTDHPTLTLVTCYPFSYIGAAPQRFIVRARLEEDSGLVTSGPIESSATVAVAAASRTLNAVWP